MTYRLKVSAALCALLLCAPFHGVAHSAINTENTNCRKNVSARTLKGAVKLHVDQNCKSISSTKSKNSLVRVRGLFLVVLVVGLCLVFLRA